MRVGAAQIVVAQVGAGQLDAAEERAGEIQRRTAVDEIGGEGLTGGTVLEAVAEFEAGNAGIRAAERQFPPAGDGAGTGSSQTHVLGIGQRSVTPVPQRKKGRRKVTGKGPAVCLACPACSLPGFFRRCQNGLLPPGEGRQDFP